MQVRLAKMLLCALAFLAFSCTAAHAAVAGKIACVNNPNLSFHLQDYSFGSNQTTSANGAGSAHASNFSLSTERANKAVLFNQLNTGKHWQTCTITPDSGDEIVMSGVFVTSVQDSQSGRTQNISVSLSYNSMKFVKRNKPKKGK